MNFKTKRKMIELKNLLYSALKTCVGTAIMSISTCFFLLPNQLSVGGFSGIGTLGYYFLNIPVGTTVLILNIPLFIISFFKNGKKFFLISVFGTVLLSLFINLFQNFSISANSKFLACIYGGILSGIGSSIVLQAKASTGGSDLLAQIIKSYKPNIKTGSVIVAFDAIVVLASTIIFGKIEIGLYSAIAIFVMGKVLDIFFEGINFSKMLIIISPKYNEISYEISKKIKRGTTAIYGKGMYKQDEKNLILCVASRREIAEIRKIINIIDKKAFIIITNVREVYGNGFKE